MEDSALTLIEQGGLPVIVGTPVILDEGETAHHYTPAIRSVTKTRVVGHKGGGAGVSVRVAKGVSAVTPAAGSKSYQLAVARSDLFEAVLQSVIGK